MKKITLCSLFISLFLLACDHNVQYNNCYQNNLIPIGLNSNNPQLNGILTPTGFAYIDGGISGIVLINTGTNGLKAFDRTCPNRDCNSPLELHYPKLICPCDQNEYSILDGTLIKGKGSCDLREYTVVKNGSSIQITD